MNHNEDRTILLGCDYVCRLFQRIQLIW